MKSIKEKSAKGLKGYLLVGPGNELTFRVPISKDPYSYTDYNLYHSDMTIIIEDDDAFVKGEDTDEPYIDYSNRTLGIK